MPASDDGAADAAADDSAADAAADDSAITIDGEIPATLAFVDEGDGPAALAFTGSTTSTLAIASIALMGSGGLLAVFSRRRRMEG